MQQDKPKAGMRLGHYALTVKLGEGIFSETWLAEHCYLENKEICIKIFTNEKFCHCLLKQKFLTTVKDLQHLPVIEDYDPTATPPYLAQEVVAGRSVRQLLREQKKFPPDTALALLVKTVQALKKMHEQNIAHLDLRPEHLMVGEKGSLKLLDYALGKINTWALSEYYKEFTGNEAAMPKPFMRSLLYKPKRQRSGLDLGISNDVFSLGILLYEMVTGTYPSRNAVFPSNLVPEIPRKLDMIYGQCCGRAEAVFENCDEILEAVRSEESVKEVLSNLPGVRLIQDNIAIVSVKTLAGDKHYVDGKNISLLSKNLDSIMATQLRFLGFDFQNIDYLNSSAIGFLVNFGDRVQKLGGATVMFHVDKKVMTILSALGLEKVIHIVDNQDQAVEQLCQTAGAQKA